MESVCGLAQAKKQKEGTKFMSLKYYAPVNKETVVNVMARDPKGGEPFIYQAKVIRNEKSSQGSVALVIILIAVPATFVILSAVTIGAIIFVYARKKKGYHQIE